MSAARPIRASRLPIALPLSRLIPRPRPRPRLRLAARARIAFPLLFLSGCISIDRPPDDYASEGFDLPNRFLADELSAAPVEDGWLVEFGDDRLLALVAEAIQHNPDLEVAAARWAEAQARIQVAGSFLLPRLEGVGSAMRSDLGPLPPSSRFEIAGQIGWEIDIWGRLRSGEAAAREAAMAEGLEFRFARLSLAAAVADAWILAVTARNQLEIDRELLAAEEFTARVTRDKIEVGALTQLEADVAEANLLLAEDAVRQSELALIEAQKALEILLGRYPASEVVVAESLPALPPDPPVGIPSELLERRPDILAASRRVRAAFHDVEAARGARLPRVTLTASLGTLLDPTSTIWTLGSNLLAPVFTGGQLEGEVRIATARERQALAAYVSVALDAFREVESALANERILAARQIHLEGADERLRSASQIALDRYDAGIIGILDLTQVRRQDFNTRSQLLLVRAERLRQRINLYLALGGAFERPALVSRDEAGAPEASEPGDESP